MAEPVIQEPAGLIHALILDGLGGALNVPLTTQLWVSGEAVWLHFDCSDPSSQSWIQHSSGLNEVAVDGLLQEESRPHVLNRGDHLLLVLRGVNLNPGADPEDMVSLRIWTDGRRILSTRRRKLLSTDDMLQALADGQGPVNTASLLIDWIDRVVRRISDTVDRFEDELLAIEDTLFDQESRQVRRELLQLRQQSIIIRRYLAPQREALNRLIAEPFSWLDEFGRLQLRGIADRQIRHIEDIDAVRERAAMAQEELLSVISEQMNARTYVLTIVAAIFLPLGFFTGLMGINVGGMPGVESGVAFWIVVGMCVTLCAALGVYFRWKNWF